MTTITETEIADMTTSEEAAYGMRRAKGALERGEVSEQSARDLWALARDRRDVLRSAEGGCPHGQPTRDDCNSCCMGA